MLDPVFESARVFCFFPLRATKILTDGEGMKGRKQKVNEHFFSLGDSRRYT